MLCRPSIHTRISSQMTLGSVVKPHSDNKWANAVPIPPALRLHACGDAERRYPRRNSETLQPAKVCVDALRLASSLPPLQFCSCRT